MKQHARTHADLDAMLIGQKTAPKGCRVLNVSPQGVMLQCEPDGRLLTFRDADLVDVHLTVQHGGGRKNFSIPSIVNRVDIKSIDVVFQHPNAELLKLIEAYRISDTHMMEASIVHSPAGNLRKSFRLSNTTVHAAAVETEDAGGRQESRSILYPVLATLVLSVCIATGAYLYTSGIDSRLGVLETITINQTNELADIRSRITSSSLQEGRYASLNARLQALTDAFGTLEGKLDTVNSDKTVAAATVAGEVTAGTPASGGSEAPISITLENPASKSTTATSTSSSQVSEISTGQNIPTDKSRPVPVPAMTPTSQEQEPETRASNTEAAFAATPEKTETQQTNKTEQPGPTMIGSTSDDVESGIGNASGKTAVTASSGSGTWIINLLSSRKKLDTDRLAEIAATHGIPVVQDRATVKGKEYWRLQVAGFGNATEARNYAIPVKKKLGIKDVWIFQQKE